MIYGKTCSFLLSGGWSDLNSSGAAAASLMHRWFNEEQKVPKKPKKSKKLKKSS
jgi:hypothetical protein